MRPIVHEIRGSLRRIEVNNGFFAMMEKFLPLLTSCQSDRSGCTVAYRADNDRVVDKRQLTDCIYG